MKSYHQRRKKLSTSRKETLHQSECKGRNITAESLISIACCSSSSGESHRREEKQHKETVRDSLRIS